MVRRKRGDKAGSVAPEDGGTGVPRRGSGGGSAAVPVRGQPGREINGGWRGHVHRADRGDGSAVAALPPVPVPLEEEGLLHGMRFLREMQVTMSTGRVRRDVFEKRG